MHFVKVVGVVAWSGGNLSAEHQQRRKDVNVEHQQRRKRRTPTTA
jgi:hypothetical protein